MLIYFATLCHNYELRFAWQMSSIIQQKGNVPGLLIDCATLEGDDNPLRFPPELFPGLTYYPTDRETFARRALTRTQQIQRAIDAKADWVFFADCDHIYDPRFFCRLRDHLVRECANVTNCIHSKWKQHTLVEPTNKACEYFRANPVMPHAWAKATGLPMMVKRVRDIAAGCMQVCKLSAIIEKTGGVYVAADKTKDGHLFNKGQRAKSDIQFRAAMGGTTSIDLPTQVHLQHRRDKEEGHHIDDQR